MEVNPTGLSLRAIEVFNTLEEILDEFINPGNSIYKLNKHDITKEFYTTAIVKKKTINDLKPEITNTLEKLIIPVKEQHNGNDVIVNIPIMLDKDTLPRNNLKKIASLNPKISIVTWKESAASINYCVVIECDNGDIGIWSNHYCNKLYF